MHHSLRVILVVVPQSNVGVLGKVYQKVVCVITWRLLLITAHH